MLSSVLVTFKESEEFYIRAVLRELRKNESLSVKRITIGQLFDKKAASIFIPENQLQDVFDKLIANEIQIFPFNDEYKTKIKETIERLRRSSVYSQDKLRAEYFRKRRISGISGLQSSESEQNYRPLIKKSPKELPTEIKSVLKNIDVNNPVIESLDINVKEGNYIVIKNMIKNNPLHNPQLKEKYIPAIKNCVKIQLERGINNASYVDTSIQKLKEIICDPEIKAITSEDLVDLAGRALISLCSEASTEELINTINLPNVGQRLNVMAAIKLAELIFEKESGVDEELQKMAVERINRRFLMTSYDVMEPAISELNKSRFNLLMNTIHELAA
jgi:hypothetical protein